MSSTAPSAKDDLLDRTVKFLAKREGIDKTLKIIRYTSRLISATTQPGSAPHLRFTALEKSIGVSRKAYRLGKFLQDVNALRKTKAKGLPWVLELIAYSGEGIYYFIEQLVWLSKAGALHKDTAASLSYTSAWAELLGYAASLYLSLLKLQSLTQQEGALLLQLAAARGGRRSSNSSGDRAGCGISTMAVEQQGVLGAVASPAACADTTSGSAATSTTTATTPTTTSSEVRAAAAANASPSGSACEVRAGQQAFTSLPQQLGHPAGSGCTSAIHLPGNICSADTGVAAALDASEVSSGSSMGKECACGVEAQLNAELAAVRRQVSMRYAAILQDLADSLLALSDLRGGKDRWLSHPTTLALAGLVSGAVSFHKNWTST